MESNAHELALLELFVYQLQAHESAQSARGFPIGYDPRLHAGSDAYPGVPRFMVSPEPISIYNRRVMRIAKHTYSPLALVLSLGLMYSQVCNVICAFSNCSAPAPIREATTVEHGGHCHQKPQPSQKDP